MKLRLCPLQTVVLCFLQLVVLGIHAARAGSATWKASPTNGDWNTAANWTPTTIPNGVSDVATFGASNQTSVTASLSTEVSTIVFNPGASAFNIIVGIEDHVLTISGAGITNNSGVTQNFPLTYSPISGELNFVNSASAGSNTVITNNGGSTLGGVTTGGKTSFFETSTASAAVFVNGGGNSGAKPSTRFYDSATAANANFTNNGSTTTFIDGGQTLFYNNSSADHGTFTSLGASYPGNPGSTLFYDNASAAQGSFTNFGGSAGGSTQFYGDSTAADATFTNYGDYGFTSFNGNSSASNASVICKPANEPGPLGGQLIFADTATADHGTFTFEGGNVVGAGGGYGIFWGGNAREGTFIIEGGQISGAGGAVLNIYGSSSAGNATFIVQGGVDPDLDGNEGILVLGGSSTGGTSRIELLGGQLLLNFHDWPGVTVGSIEGNGTVVSSGRNLTVGANNLDTTFSGVITAETQGTLTKIGRGKLVLTGSNIITRTTVEAGQLVINNRRGSGTGPGAVQVHGGTLAGIGIIAGAVTIGDDSGSKAVLSPGQTIPNNRSLTLQGNLTFKSEGSYKFRVSTARLVADSVIVNGVTINPGAQFTFHDESSGTVTSGTVFTLISNTSANPISGTFSNLSDGAIVTISGNNFQADYQGGDGNDLTLTVVP